MSKARNLSKLLDDNGDILIENLDNVSVGFGDLTTTPTTLSGYGITDAATSAQGALADSAVQPGDNISGLTNDSGYATTTYVDTAESDAVTTANAYTDSALAGISSDAITEGNSSVEVVDTGSGYITATTDGTERMRIDASGNMGIGTTSPDFPLEVYKNTTAEVAIGSNNGGTAQLSFYENDSTTKEFFVKYDGIGNNGVIGTSGNSNAMVIARDTGRVGIGTSSPSTPLHIYSNSGNNHQIRLQNAYSTGSDWTLNAYGANGSLFIGNTADRVEINSSGDFKFNSGYGSAATAYGCRAFVNFDGTGTVSIRRAGNVSSITDNGSGDYTINFSTSMVDDDYTSASMGRVWPAQQSEGFCVAHANYSNDGQQQRTTSSLRIAVLNHVASLGDSPSICVSIFR